jgi:hypothetical protein
MQKKLYQTLFFFTAALCAQRVEAAGDPQLQWGAVLRSNDATNASAMSTAAIVKTNANGEIFTFGSFSSHATNAYKYAIYKHYDASGTLTEKATPVGALKETTGANANLFLYKQDAQGKILWQVTSRWGDVATAYSQLTPTHDGGALLAAKVRFTASSQFAGDTLLQLVDNSGAMHALKWTGSTQNAYQIAAAKISSSGQVQWLKLLLKVSDAANLDAVRATGLEVDSDGSFYLGGSYSDTITFNKAGGDTQRLIPHNIKDGKYGGDLLLAKLDPDGNLLWSVEATGVVASQSISSMTLHKKALFIYGNIHGTASAASSTLLGHAITPSALEYNAYSARIDVGGDTPTARWVTLLNSRTQTNTKGGRIKVTNIDYDGGSVFLSGSFTGFIEKANGDTILTNDITTGTSAAQLKAFIIRQSAYTGETLGGVRDDSTNISETYAVALRGSKIHAYGYTSTVSAWYRTYNADFTGEIHHPLLAGGTAFDGAFLDSTLVALARGRNATAISGVTGGIAAEAPSAFSGYFLSFGVDGLWQKSLLDQLENAVDSARAINSLIYTPDSWGALEAATTVAETLLNGAEAPSAQDVSAALSAIRSAKGAVIAYNPEFQWGAVIRSDKTSETSPTIVTQTISVSADGNSVFTLSQFVTSPNGTTGSSAIYKGYDANGNLTVSDTAKGATESSTTYSSKQNLLIYKLDRQGNTLWKLSSDCGQVDVTYSQAAPTADGGLFLAIKACFSGNTPPTDSTLLRLVENDGVTKHVLKWENPYTFNARHVIFAKVDANGHVLWLKAGITLADTQIPGTTNTTGRGTDAIYISGLEEDKDGNFYLAGRYVRDVTFTKPNGSKQTFTPRNAGGWNGDSQTSRGDALLVKLDPNGNLLWNLETAGTLVYQSVGAMTLANNKLFIFGNAQAGQAGVDYFAIQGDTIFPSDKTNAYAARFDVINGTPTLQWFTLLNARQQTNTRGGYIWTHNVDYDGGELLLTGRFTGFIDVDGKEVLANDFATGSTTAQRGYIIRLNPSTGKVSGATMYNNSTGYYRAAFRENRVYAFGYNLGANTFCHTYNPDFSSLAEQSLFSGNLVTGWDAAFFDDQLITIHRTRTVAPSYILGLTEEHALRKESVNAYSPYYTSHTFQGLQRQSENFREMLEDTLNVVTIAFADSTPYTSATWKTLDAALNAAGATLAGKTPITGETATAALSAIHNAVNGLITLDVSALIAQLQEAVDSAKVRYPQEEEYTAQTWSALQTAISDAETLLAAPADATEAQLAAAINTLNSAVSGLVTRALDEARKTLVALVGSAQGYEADIYTQATYTALQAAINAAQPLLDDNTSTVAQLESAGQNIGSAIDGLVTKVSVAEVALQDTINATQEAYAEETYTAVTYAALQDSLAAAQALLDDGEEHTVAELENAVTGIGNAIAALVTKVSAERIALQEAIENTRATYVQANYTTESWAALQTALANADAALEDPDASYIDLAAKTTALESAIAGLAPVSTGVYRVAGSSITVTTRPATIVVRGASAGVVLTVVNTAGSVIHRRISTGDVQEFSVKTGLYIVTAGKEAVKTAVY